MKKLNLVAVAGVLAAAPLLGAMVQPGDAAEASATIVARWKNCTVVNQRLPHGVGRTNAHDRTSGVPVTTFRRDTTLYKKAINANGGLDRDKDGIACEKR